MVALQLSSTVATVLGCLWASLDCILLPCAGCHRGIDCSCWFDEVPKRKMRTQLSSENIGDSEWDFKAR